MRQDRRDAAFSLRLLKQNSVLLRQRLCFPLVAVLEKNLDGFAADPLAALEGLVHASGNGHVGACQQFSHRFSLKSPCRCESRSLWERR